MGDLAWYTYDPDGAGPLKPNSVQIDRIISRVALTQLAAGALAPVVKVIWAPDGRRDIQRRLGRNVCGVAQNERMAA